MTRIAAAVLLPILTMAGQHALAENEPKVISLSCNGTVNVTGKPEPNEAKSKKPEMSYVEFGPWLEFLRAFELIKIENETIAITPGGRDFLLYLAGANLNEAKPG
jgi:hypothetical protein